MNQVLVYPLIDTLEQRVSLQVIQSIVAKTPDCVRVPRRNSFPVHIACEHGCSPEVIEFLSRQFPEGLQMQDDLGNSPLHLACGDRASSLTTIKFLTEQSELALAMTNKMGFLPVHLACMSHSVEVVQFMVEKTTLKDAMNHSGGHLTLLHLACKGYRNSREDMLKIGHYLIETFPEMVTTPTKHGLLPLHFLITGDEPCDELVGAMVVTDPYVLLAKTLWGESPLERCRKYRPDQFHLLDKHVDTLDRVVRETLSGAERVGKKYSVPSEVMMDDVWGFIAPSSISAFDENRVYC